MMLKRLKLLTVSTLFLLQAPLVFSAPNGVAAASEKLGEAGTGQYEGMRLSVNINKAQADELASLLKGVGLNKAQAIVDYRNEHGAFTKVEELTNVKGIGQKTIEVNQQRILLK